MHLSICNLDIPPPPGKPPGIWIFRYIFGGQIPVPQFQKAVQMPHM